MSLCGRDDERRRRQTSEDRDTQPMEAGGEFRNLLWIYLRFGWHLYILNLPRISGAVAYVQGLSKFYANYLAFLSKVALHFQKD